MSDVKRIVFCFTFVILLILVMAPAALANSAGPYSLTVVVQNPPDRLSVSLRFADGSELDSPINGRKKAWEIRFKHYYFAQHELDGAVLLVRTDTKSFECPVPELKSFNSLLVLDINAESFSGGLKAVRTATIVSICVAFTLLIEGLLFLAFGYRKLRSWLVFVSVNLVTQGILNFVLNGWDALEMPWLYSLAIFPIEIIVIVAEASVLIWLLREHSKKRAYSFAITANMASWLIGIFVIPYLPV